MLHLPPKLRDGGGPGASPEGLPPQAGKALRRNALALEDLDHVAHIRVERDHVFRLPPSADVRCALTLLRSSRM